MDTIKILKNMSDGKIPTQHTYTCPNCEGRIIFGASESCRDRTLINISVKCSDCTLLEENDGYPKWIGWEKLNSEL